MKKDHKKVWKKPELKKLDGTDTKSGGSPGTVEGGGYYLTVS